MEWYWDATLCPHLSSTVSTDDLHPTVQGSEREGETGGEGEREGEIMRRK